MKMIIINKRFSLLLNRKRRAIALLTPPVFFVIRNTKGEIELFAQETTK